MRLLPQLFNVLFFTYGLLKWDDALMVETIRYSQVSSFLQAFSLFPEERSPERRIRGSNMDGEEDLV